MNTFDTVERVCTIKQKGGFVTKEKLHTNELFRNKLLRSMVTSKPGMKEKTWYTKDDVRNRYLEVYPPSFFERKLNLLVPRGKIDYALTDLVACGLVRREVTRFTYKALDEDTPVYAVTAKGRDFINSLKGKK